MFFILLSQLCVCVSVYTSSHFVAHAESKNGGDESLRMVHKQTWCQQACLKWL